MLPFLNRLSRLAPPTTGPYQQGYGVQEDGDNNRLSQLNYDTPILDQYKQELLNNYPNYDDYKPSFGRKLLAGLAGSNFNEVQAIKNAPWDEAQNRYYAKTKILGEGANVEEKQIANKRNIANNEAMNAIREEQNRIRQQSADTALQKERDIHETKVADMERKVNEANAKLAEKEKEYNGKREDSKSLLEFHKAQLDALNARHQLDLAQKESQLSEQRRLHDELVKKWDTEHEDRNKARPTQETTITEELKDAKGNVTGSKTITKGAKTANTGTIKVKRKSDGAIGTMPASNFNSALYDKVE